MSVELMGKVWKIKLSHSQQSVLLAMADFANDDGRNCYPSHRRLAWKTGYSDRQVSRIINELIGMGIVKVIKLGTNNQPPRYWIRVDKGTPKKPYEDDRSPDEEEAVGGDNLSPQVDGWGDRLSPPDVAFVTPRGDSLSPDPLVNHQYKETIKEGREKPPPAPSIVDDVDFMPESQAATIKPPYSAGVVDGKVPPGMGDTPARVYHEVYPLNEEKYELSEAQRLAIDKQVTDLGLWREVVTAWALEDHRPKNIRGQLDWYKDPSRFRRKNGINIANTQTNYQRPRDADFSNDEWSGFLSGHDRGPY